MMNDKKREISSLLASDLIVKCKEYKYLYELEDSDFTDVIIKAITLAFDSATIRKALKVVVEEKK